MTKKRHVDTEDEQDEGDWVDVKEEKSDSIKHHEGRKARIEAENAEKKQAAEAENTRLVENQEIANFKGLPQPGETRDQLLDRIRKLREKPPEVEVPLFRSEGLQKEFEAEQKAGQEAVAKAQAAMERNQAAAAELAKGEKNQTG
jgi:hypothetical protein